MSWHTHKRLTAAARQVFPGMGVDVKVRTNGRIFLVQNSPWGKLVMLRVQRGYLVAAERPSAPVLDPGKLPPSLAAELAVKGLKAWRLVPAGNCNQVLHSLVDDGPSPETDAWSPYLDAWSPYLIAWQKSSPLTGEGRVRLAEQLAALLSASSPSGPIVHLYGPDGVGKRTVIAAAAQQAGLTPAGELPLSRLLLDRVFHYGVEMVVDALLIGNNNLSPDHLLVISEAHLLDTVEAGLRDLVLLRELRRSTCPVLLISTAPLAGRGLLSLACPGLEGDESEKFIAAVHPEVQFAGSAFRLLTAASTDPNSNTVVPGRMLYLIALAKAMLAKQPVACAAPADSTPALQGQGDLQSRPDTVLLAPDEISAAASLAGRSWSNKSREQS